MKEKNICISCIKYFCVKQMIITETMFNYRSQKLAEKNGETDLAGPKKSSKSVSINLVYFSFANFSF